MSPRIFCRAHRADRGAVSGQTSIEFLVICTALCVALFSGNPSLLDRMLTAIQEAHAQYTFGMSLP